LKTLRHIYSTGSPLAPTSFDFVYKSIKPDVLLASITGGTDICSLFAGFESALPVYRGEIQCRMLGMAIQAFGPDGLEVEPGAEGELVCTKPFPCQPLGFWPLEGMGVPQELVNEASSRHRAAYFGVWPGVWCEWASSMVFVMIERDCRALVDFSCICRSGPIGWRVCQGTAEANQAGLNRSRGSHYTF
jgi:acyl-coenzyme A synthetase/AMP-(fatty) acid ligase